MLPSKRWADDGYFDNGEAKALAFRKRALHPGSAIGPHPIGVDEEDFLMFIADPRETTR